MNTLAIIVNYKAAELTVRAAQSVLESDSLGPVQVVVVDNSEDAGEAERLRSELPSTVELRVSPENIGFGRGCNLAFEQGDAELVLLLNPDARLLPGSLSRLQRTLASAEGVAAVGPQIFWDEECTFYLPPSYPPELIMLEPLIALRGRRSVIQRVLSILWRRRAMTVWRASTPMKVKNLSGGHVLLKRKAVQRAGGLFDPRFFLYFEDTDLFMRLRQRGFTLTVEPRARVIHHYDQCGKQEWGRKQRLMEESRALFLEKHCRGWQARLRGLASRRRKPEEAERGRRRRPHFTAPFVLEVPRSLQGEWLFEWSPNPAFIPAAGRFASGRSMTFSETCWRMLAPGMYFGRLGGTKGFPLETHEVSWAVGGNGAGS